MEFTPDTAISEDTFFKPVGITHSLRAQIIHKNFSEDDITKLANKLPNAGIPDITKLAHSYIRFLITGKCNNSTSSLFLLAPHILLHVRKGVRSKLCEEYLTLSNSDALAVSNEEDIDKWLQSSTVDEQKALASDKQSGSVNKILINYSNVSFISSKIYNDQEKKSKLDSLWQLVSDVFGNKESADSKEKLARGLDSLFLHMCIMFRLKGQNKSSVQEYFNSRYASIVTAITGLDESEEILFNIKPCDAALEIFHQALQPTVASSIPLAAILVMMRDASGIIYGKWITDKEEQQFMEKKQSPEYQRLSSLFNGGFGLHLSYNGMAAMYYVLYIHAKCKMNLVDILNNVGTTSTVDFLKKLSSQITIHCQRKEVTYTSGEKKIWNGSWTYKYARSIDPSYFSNLSSRDNSSAAWLAAITYYVTNDDGILNSQLIKNNPLDEDALRSAKQVAQKLSPIRGVQKPRMLFAGEIE
nr:MAG: putative N protein [Rhabdoviridae sp.]